MKDSNGPQHQGQSVKPFQLDLGEIMAILFLIVELLRSTLTADFQW